MYLFIMAERLGVEPSTPIKVLRISNPLHYRPAPAPYFYTSVLLDNCQCLFF